MKYLTIAIITFFGLATTNTADAQDVKSKKLETFELKVQGVCGMCENRIETTTYDLKGVKSAEWDLDSDKLTVVVKKGKITRQEIADALAKIGHSSELAKAIPAAYQELPKCCRYADGVQKHSDGGK